MEISQKKNVIDYTDEKVNFASGFKFGGGNKGKAILKGKNSAEMFHSHLANILQLFGFEPPYYDNDVRIKRDATATC